MTDVTIEEMPLPASVNGPAGTAFAEMVAVHNEIEAAAVGNYDLAETPAVVLAQNSNPYEPLRIFVARINGRIVGRSLHELQSGDDVRSAWVTAEVLPEFRRRGIGAQLFERAMEIAVNDGRSIVQSFAMHSTIGGGRIDSPTGFGSVPRDDPGARFLLAKGFSLAQVDRMSRLPLLASTEVPEAPAGYDLEQWVGETPTNRLGDIATMQQRMSTDVPLGETDYQPEHWDEERVRDLDRRRLAEGRLWMITAARHIASDSLVAFTELATAHDATRPVYNNNTLVLREHRGLRLGMLVKAANLRLLNETAPGHPSVYTWNAEENRHMLGVNETIGFVPVGYEGSWKRAIS